MTLIASIVATLIAGHPIIINGPCLAANCAAAYLIPVLAHV